jgi:single-strand DNA-binding protein
MTINKAIIIGNVGKDPEVRFSASGSPVANFSVATTEKWTDKQGQKQEQTEWHRIVAFGKVAEIVQKYITKGSKVYIEGKIKTRKWKDINGQDRYTTEINSNLIQMLDSKDISQRSESKVEKRDIDYIQEKKTKPEFDDVIPF